MIEISFVILIISIALIAMIKSADIIEKSRTSKAIGLTKSSPLSEIKDITMWLETTLESSLKEKETESFDRLSTDEISAGKGSITKWYDRNPHHAPRRNAEESTANTAPKYYTDCINKLPCINFLSDPNFLKITNSLDLRLSDYTIFIVEKRNSPTSMPIIGSDSYNIQNESLEIGYLDSDTIYWNQGSSSFQIDFTDSLLANENPKIHTFVNATNKSSSLGPQYYLNYYLNGESIPGSNIVNVYFRSLKTASYLNIGKSSSSFYDGKIGEIIIIPYAISKSERILITQYLSKKWNIK